MSKKLDRVIEVIFESGQKVWFRDQEIMEEFYDNLKKLFNEMEYSLMFGFDFKMYIK